MLSWTLMQRAARQGQTQAAASSYRHQTMLPINQIVQKGASSPHQAASAVVQALAWKHPAKHRRLRSDLMADPRVRSWSGQEYSASHSHVACQLSPDSSKHSPTAAMAFAWAAASAEHNHNPEQLANSFT